MNENVSEHLKLETNSCLIMDRTLKLQKRMKRSAIDMLVWSALQLNNSLASFERKAKPIITITGQGYNALYLQESWIRINKIVDLA